jgi:hypothetical protein
MFVFGFPRFLIPIFAGLILLMTVLSRILPAGKNAMPPNTPQKPVSHPILFRILNAGIVAFSFLLVSILLFGFVTFMNSWSRSKLYEGQRHHQTEFRVTRVYYQAHTRGGPDVFASGMVEGNREWMSLLPYLHTMPHDQSDLESRVPAGTAIAIYLFPDLKGRSRVQVFDDTPPAEGNRRAALATLNHALSGLALTAAILFVLVRVRRSYCYEAPTSIPSGQYVAS